MINLAEGIEFDAGRKKDLNYNEIDEKEKNIAFIQVMGAYLQ